MAVAASSLQQRRDARLERRRPPLAGAAQGQLPQPREKATTVEEGGAAAKVSKSAFYEFFTSKEDCFRELLEQEGGALIRDVLAAAATGHDHHERLRLGITTFVRSCFERSSVARLLIVESVGLSENVDNVRYELQSRFADAVAEEVRHAIPHDPFYADKDPHVFGRAVVGAVSDAVGYFLTHPGVDSESLAGSLCRIFAP